MDRSFLERIAQPRDQIVHDDSTAEFSKLHQQWLTAGVQQGFLDQDFEPVAPVTAAAILSGENLVGLDSTKGFAEWRNGRPKAVDAHITSQSLKGASLRYADLRRSDLRGFDLEGADLRNAILEEANLSRAHLIKAKLAHASLSGCNLEWADLTHADLHGADLSRARMQAASLEGATGFQYQSVAHSDLTNAILPSPSGILNVLETLEDACKISKNVFLTMLAACLFAIITLYHMTDAELIGPRKFVTLPILGTQLPVAGFFDVGPFLLLGLYLYFHLYLQRVWEQISTLPAFLPDGRPLYDAIYPWIVLSHARFHIAYVARLRRTRLERIQLIISVLLGWMLAPSTLFVFWWRYLPRQHARATTFHEVEVILSVGMASVFLWYARSTLRGPDEKPTWWRLLLDARAQQSLSKAKRCVVRFVVYPGHVIVTLTILWFIMTHIKADEQVRKLHLAVGTDFQGVDLRHLNFKDATLLGVILKKADLTGVQLEGADLRGADLHEAKLNGAVLRGAKIDNDTVISPKWRLVIAVLDGKGVLKDLSPHTDLTHAHLQGADLYGSSLTETDLSYADLRGANLAKADMTGVTLHRAAIDARSIKEAHGLERAEVSKTACVFPLQERSPLECRDLWAARPCTFESPYDRIRSSRGTRVPIRAPLVGPIVGHTTDTSVRLWIRAQPKATQSDSSDDLAGFDSRLHGIVWISPAEYDDKPLFKSRYFPVHSSYDHTGVVDIGSLTPDTNYRARFATAPFKIASADIGGGITLAPNVPVAWFEDLEALDQTLGEARFRTFPNTSPCSEKLAFVFGSSHYLQEGNDGDSTFKSILELVEEHMEGRGETPVRFVLMNGNQIYADTFNRFITLGLADTYDEFQERYLTAFGSKHLRTLLANSTTYMILDDHEIEDNWTQDRTQDRKKRLLFNIAITAYQSYQWIHGPRNYGRNLYYSYECAGYPFFVLDVRTQRYLEKDPPQILSDNQLVALKEWLIVGQAREHVPNIPKFIVTPTPIVPDTPKRENRDGWEGFSTMRKDIFDFIHANGIRNVIFLSGGLNASNIYDIRLSGSSESQALEMLSITSSPFSWPFPHPKASDLVQDSKAEGKTVMLSNGIELNYELLEFTGTDNFTHVAVDRGSNSVTVATYDRKKRPETSRTVPLEPW